jgi:hypothetical protein
MRKKGSDAYGASAITPYAWWQYQRDIPSGDYPLIIARRRNVPGLNSPPLLLMNINRAERFRFSGGIKKTIPD